uniref:ATP synthase complex subunit 8 n=1 Tax=Histeroidea sp. 2 KM-2017 TaxID=2219435 RepID=A0A346RG74_9COLE|nr:ATP synthase F0 subunit 8 [Histeroidea sp. 2 KM-2017]
MPQMAPLSWVTLMFYFIFIFLSYNMMNYFIFTYPTKSIKSGFKKKSINWKW